MKKILVAVDGSAPSLVAARLARELAQATGAELTAVYALVPMVMAGELPFSIMPDLMEAELARGREVLKDVVKELGVPDASTFLLEGPVAECVSQFAETEGYDLVVVGSRGRHAVTRMLLGSVAEYCVRNGPCPVVVVRQQLPAVSVPSPPP